VPHTATYSDAGTAGPGLGVLTAGGSTASVAGNSLTLTQSEAYGVVLVDWAAWATEVAPLDPLRAQAVTDSYAVSAKSGMGVAHRWLPPLVPL
jgi:hypothetical protein